MPLKTPLSLSRVPRNLLFDAEKVLGKHKAAQPLPPVDTKRHATTVVSNQESSDQANYAPYSSSNSSEFDADEGNRTQFDVISDSSKGDPPPCDPSHASQKHVFQTRIIHRRHSFSACEITNHVTKEPANPQCAGIVACTISSSSQKQKLEFPIVYRIKCPEHVNRSRYHKTLLYEDDPLKAHFTDGLHSLHLSGNKPIHQLQDHVRRFQHLSFVIIKNRQCGSQSGLFSYGTKRDEAMLILDEKLRQTIQKVATCSIEPFVKNGSLEFFAPYQPLYLHRELLQAYAQSVKNPLGKEIKAVIQYVMAKYGHEYAEAEALLSQRKTTRRHMDKIFWPNQLIVHSGRSDHHGERPGEERFETMSVYVVKEWPRSDGGTAVVPQWNWNYDGYFCVRSYGTNGVVAPVEDENEPFPIEKLWFYPITVLSEKAKESLRQRGKKFWDLRQPNFIYCTAADRIKPGRYMIDHAMHAKLHNTIPIALHEDGNKQTDPWSCTLNEKSVLKGDDYLIMPKTIPCYDFLTKEWTKLPVSSIMPIRWDKQPFEELVLPEETKRLVRAMVTIRASSIKSKREEQLRANFDIVPGKGNGLIMLFHGSPGTGKTLTAESVAEIAEMPLYPITCGDIGTDPDKVEEYLRLVFELGQRWNCVLLLDEADVFLEQRTLTDLQRNSLVSVFLRMLEYYEGILILTSNRVGIFDEAFRSRIHIALHYEDLKPRARKQIWMNFLTRLEDTEEGEGVEEIKDRLDELARHQLNGREIRNALSTARQLASYEGKTMGWEHVELAIKTADKFGNYLKEVHGHTDREWAKEKGERL